MSDTPPASPATPREAFDMLTTGNLRFAAGTPRHPDQDAARRADTACIRGLDLPSAPAVPSATAPTPDSR